MISPGRAPRGSPGTGPGWPKPAALSRLRSRLKAAGFGQPGPVPGEPRGARPGEIIDAEYRVIEPNEPPRR